jgi:alcohol dehydrogenase
MGLDANPLQLSLADLILKRIKIIGSQQNHREFLFEALDMVARGKVKVMAETYPLRDINTAYEKVKNGKVRFRAVVTM